MLQDFQNILVFSITIGEVIGNIMVALICSFIISLVYRWTYRGTSYSVSFVNSIVSLAMITALVIMVIGNNLARAFGLVGAMSIIRFRTAVKDTQDIVFIFFSLLVGMAAGVGLHLIAIVGTTVICTTIFILTKTDYGTIKRQEFLLEFSFTTSAEKEEEVPYLPILRQYCKKFKLINVKSFGDGELLESSFYVNLKRKDKGEEFIQNLGQLEGINHVNLFFDEDHF